MIRHFGLTTDNRKKCPACGFQQGMVQRLGLLTKFYESVLGMKIVKHGNEIWKAGETVIKLKIVKLARPGQEKTGPYLELVDGEWGNHIAFTVDDWPMNARLIEPVRLDGHDGNGVEVKFCMDVAGNMIELVKEKK